MMDINAVVTCCGHQSPQQAFYLQGFSLKNKKITGFLRDSSQRFSKQLKQTKL